MANLYRGGTVAERRLIRLDPNDTARALAKVPLFAGCSDADLRDITSAAHGHIPTEERHCGCRDVDAIPRCAS